MIKILAIAFPILLFLFKYLLPILAEDAMSERDLNTEKIKQEILQFPLDLMFIAISYVIPKIIEILRLPVVAKCTVQQVAQKSNSQEVIIYFVICLIMLFLLPFFVFLVKLCIKWHSQERMRKRNILVLFLYIIPIICIVISMFIF